MPGSASTSTELEQSVENVESRLLALGDALRVHHAEAVEAEAAELQRALAAAVDQLRRSARAGQLSPQLRQRLALASGHVAAQRESLARASAALDRAIDVLLPSPSPRVAYSAAGLSERPSHSGLVRA
jgi:plasmid stabilization system protein ParE